MTSEHHERVKQIFLVAAQLDPDKRDAFLSEECSEDESLRREVQTLLEHHQPDDGFLEPKTSIFIASAAEIASGAGSSAAFSDAGRFTPGTVIAERYRLVGLLGRGGMGEVYRAEDLTLKQTVALKFLPPHLAGDARWLERFRNEVRLARQVAHPNVCRVYDITRADVAVSDASPDEPARTEPRWFITMEFVDGDNLASLLHRIGRLPKDKALQIVRQLCAGLAAAHKKGVLHRDLKPANIMIDGQGQVRITDFGLAVPFEAGSAALSGAEVRAGTPAYMSPEQLSGKQVSPKSDIYALGLVLYEIFTGKQAFKADNPLEYQRLHEQTTPTNPSRLIDDMDATVERVIMRCLEKDPSKRPGSALAVAAALPGGDPLAAALAAGETPSPEMVAAAGGAGSLTAAVAVMLLVSILVGVGMAVWLSPKVNLIHRVPMDKAPAVLADRARQIVYSLGYAEPPADSIYGFNEDQSFLDAIEKLNSPSRWDQLSQGQPSAIFFWYRQNPKLLIPKDRKRRVSLYDPPRMQPGTITVVLDPTGRLVAFWAIPFAAQESDAPISELDPGEMNLDDLFEYADLDLTAMESIDPTRVPPMYADEVRTWIGDYPTDSSFKVKVDVATFRGWLVHFSAAPKWRGDVSSIRAEPTGASTIIRGTHRQRILTTEHVQKSLFVVALCFGSILAWRNLKLGRGDRSGAFRISMFIFVAGVVEILLGATHVPEFLSELTLMGEAFGYALYLAAQIWLFYMALEPFVRRIWPETIISWTRLIGGRFRDPRVGRDVLIGATFAVWALVARQVGHLMPTWFNWPANQPWNVVNDDLSRLLGSRLSLAVFAQTQFIAIYYPLLFLLVLLLLRAALRKGWLATAVFVLVLSLPQLREANWQISWPIMLVLLTIMTLLLTRFGIVTIIAATIVYRLLTDFPPTPDVNAWHAATGYFALGTALLLAAYGYVVSRTGRPLLTEQLLET